MCLSASPRLRIFVWHGAYVCASNATGVGVLSLRGAPYMPPTCQICALAQQRMCVGCASHMPRTCLGFASGVPEVGLGRAADVQWMCFGCAVGMPGVCFCFIVGSLGVQHRRGSISYVIGMRNRMLAPGHGPGHYNCAYLCMTLTYSNRVNDLMYVIDLHIHTRQPQPLIPQLRGGNDA